MRDFIWIHPTTPEELIVRTCVKSGCKRDALLGPSRSRRIAWPRQDLMLALHEMGLSYPEIGRLLGSRHHTTIIEGAERAKARIEARYKPRSVRPKVSLLRTKLPGPPKKKREPRRPIDPHIAFLAAVHRAHRAGESV